MLRIENSFLRSKFARRIFSLFVVSTIVPVMIIALLSYTHISTQLGELGYKQSHIVAKAVGMELYRRLTLARNELARVTAKLGVETHSGHAGRLSALSNDEAPDFKQITFLNGSAGNLSLRGKPIASPIIDNEQQQQLARGKTIFLIREDPKGSQNVLFMQAIGHNHPKELIVGKVDANYFWTVNELLPPENSLLIVSPSGQILHSSIPSLRNVVRRLRSEIFKSSSGHFEWSENGKAFDATYWSIFIHDLFASNDIVIMVNQPASLVLQPLSNFRNIYIPWLILAIFCISFLAANRIRKKIVPLLTLRDATQRIANGDFADKVNITSDDEFAVLGDAFNAMSARLDAQFTSLATMAEIDRLILSSFDERFIITTVLEHAGDLTPCSMAAVLTMDEHNESSGILTSHHITSEKGISEREVILTREAIRHLWDNPWQLLYDEDSDFPSYLIPLIDAETRALVLFPIFAKQRVSTVMIFGFSEASMAKEQDWSELRKFADHIAVALANAGWEERLYHQAHYDTLTNLPNRALLKDRLEQAISRAERNQSGVGVLFLDLDRFKLINDSLGHAAGDTVLKKTADILSRQVRSIDTVVRFGGDEFVMIVPDIGNEQDAVFELGVIVDKISNALANEYEVENQAGNPEMSIGIALYPKDGTLPEELVKNADAAMYHAKNNGRSRYEFFAPELNAVATQRLQVEQDIRRALARDEFLLHYQVKLDCLSGKPLGAEALIRWHHPERGFVSPAEFIGIAEETGLIRDIGDWVIGKACRQIAEWRTLGLTPLPIAVNVSPTQFRERDFIANLEQTLAEHRLETEMLELEITETTIMHDTNESIAKLNACRELGFSIAIDDFGTGHSSLSYLRQLPIDILKIDQSFISVISEEDDAHAIVAATIMLAHKLGLKIIAEGVETEEHRRMLQEMRCDVLQGYLFSIPLPAEQFAVKFLEAGRGDAFTLKTSAR